MDRVTRHKIKHDKFVDDMGTAYSFMRGHARGVWFGVAAIVLAIVGALAYGFYRSGEEKRAQARLGEAIEIMNTPLDTQLGETAPGPKFKTEQEKVAKAQPIFQDVAKKFEGTDAADVAELYLARFAAERGDVASARPILEEFLREHSGHILAAAAKRSLYDLRIGAGETQQVIADLEKELTESEGLLPNDVVLSLLAQAYENTGNATKAREAYQRIVNEFPDSPYTIDAQRKLVQG